MKYILYLVLLLLPALAAAQSTVVTAQVLDPTGQRYCNASITANLTNPSGKTPLWNGFPMTATTWSTDANSDARFSMQLPDLSFIAPATGVSYSFTICANNPGTGLPSPGGQPFPPCFYYAPVTSVVGSSVDLTAGIQSVSLPGTPSMCGGGGGNTGTPGNIKAVPNCTAGGTVVNETVQESSQVIGGIAQTCATVGTLGSTSIIGICTSGCGNGGTALVATGGTALCFGDGPFTQGDYIIPSTSILGFCNDASAARPTAAVETLGIVAIPNSGGSGTAGTIQIAPLSLLLPGSTGGSGTVNPCGASGAIAYYPVPGMQIACDISFTTDGAGHWLAKSGGFTDTSFAGFYFQVQGPAPTLAAANAVYVFPPTSVGTTYGLVWPSVQPTTGCATFTASGSTSQLSSTGTPCGSGAGSVTSITATTPVVVTPSPITSTGVVSCPTCTTGITTGKLGTPSAPVLSTNGSAGAVSYSYGVVVCQDTGCLFHTPISAITTIATGNATLSSSNSINLKTYMDSFYGGRGALVCRTASAGTPGTTGIITGNLGAPLLAGKIFVDTGLAGDGTNCITQFASDTTLTTPFCQVGSSLPGAGLTTPGFPCGVDGPPLIPSAFDDEMMQNFGAPGDVNNTFWTKVNFGSATATWSSGTIILDSDTTAGNNLEMLTEATALPGTPYTYVAYVDFQATANPGGCMLGLRESSTGKIVTMGLVQNNAIDTVAASGGVLLIAQNWTSPTASSNIHFMPYRSDGYYLKIQNTGTNLNMSWSPSGDGINFFQLATETVATGFTSSPNQLMIAANSTNPAVNCVFDYVRRTQ